MYLGISYMLTLYPSTITPYELVKKSKIILFKNRFPDNYLYNDQYKLDETNILQVKYKY